MSLIVADISAARVARVESEFAATSAGLDEILTTKADVLAPCALGAILTEQSIPQLKARIVAGGANNQLEVPADGQRLHDAGILYAPDYVINGGGIINVAHEYYGGSTEEAVWEQVGAIGARLTGIFTESAARDVPTNVVADEQAAAIIAAG